ncbi:hypothetical protein GL279_11255 [Paracoccus limosus]|uniref:PepSY domain-containing protein n=1 Tax=Paracoccus limosus TaxID=913252 RepID=A0A844H2M5_9RHOB|nr:hypothetical protein [Paracoccus limosus]MTH35179.1 hypothetical protein [Paracoccus limosus]
MSRNFAASVAALALLAGLSAPVLAQDAPAAPAEQAQTLALPQVLRDAGLRDFDIRPTRHGSRVAGKLADGTELGGFMDDKGALRGVRVEGDAVLPATLIEQLVPGPVREQPLFAELAKVKAVFLGPEGVMVAGLDAKDLPVRAGFATDGTLMRFERGGPRERLMGPMGGPGDHRDKDDKEPRGHGMRDRGPQDHGPRGHGPDGKGHGPKGHGPEGHGRDGKGPDGMRPMGGDDRGAPAVPGTAPTPEEVRASLADAGYTEVGQILQQGPVTVAQATNPEGEPVLVEIGIDGQVLRELNR